MSSRSAQNCVHEGNDPLVEDLLALKQRVRESSHLSSNYGRAIASIRAHPTPLRSAREARRLKNIGNYLSNQIHCILKKRGLVDETRPLVSTTPLPATLPLNAAAIRTVDRIPRDYLPVHRKQPWYALLALLEARAVDAEAAVPLAALLQRMRHAGYTGDSDKLRACLTSLHGTHDVVKRSDLGFYFLTEKGQRSAELCRPESLTGSSTSVVARAAVSDTSVSATVTGKQTLAGGDTRPCSGDSVLTCIEVDDSNDSDDSALSEEIAEPDPEPMEKNCTALKDMIRETDTWELVLLLDHREIIERRNPHILERKLLERNVSCEVRALGVGDVQWIARRHRVGADTQEFMMNVIVERKEVHDLSSSIIDRRFVEQKLRLATVREHCGHVHVIYLVEGSLTQITTVRTSGLHTTMGRTQVQNNFFIQQCRNADETVTFLARVHARLLSNFPPVSGCVKPATTHLLSRGEFTSDSFTRGFCLPPQTFAPFNSLFRKKSQFTVHDIFQRMLLQAPGLSAAKTVSLSAKYSNFRELVSALHKRGRDSEVEHVRCGKTQRRLGLKTREFLGELLTCSEYAEDA